MNTVDKAETKSEAAAEPKRRGRPPKKQDQATPMGNYIAQEAKKARARKADSKVTDKWYELKGHKLSLCKQVATGTVYKTYVGTLNDTKAGKEIKEYVLKLKAEGRLRQPV